MSSSEGPFTEACIHKPSFINPSFRWRSQTEVPLNLKLMIQSLLWCAVLFAFGVTGQTQLPSTDERFLTELSARLELRAEQFDALQRLYLSAQLELDSIDNEIRHIQTHEDNEELAVMMIPVLQQRKKDAREQRELLLRSVLTDEQRKRYEEEIRPTAKPQVLHFGVHDRMNCNICNR